MSFSRYHSHTDPIWPDGTFKEVFFKMFREDKIISILKVLSLTVEKCDKKFLY